MSKKICVIGANGYIGRSLCIALEKVNIDVIKVTRQSDPWNNDNWIHKELERKKLLNEILTCSFVINLSQSGPGSKLVEQLDTNVLLPFKIATFLSEKRNSLPFLHLCSTNVYRATNSRGKLAPEETHINCGWSLQNRFVQELLVSSDIASSIELYLLRIPNVFGYVAPCSLYTSNSSINKMLWSAYFNGQVYIFRNGGSRRFFLHISQVVNHIMNSFIADGCVRQSTALIPSSSFSYQEVFEIIQSIMPSPQIALIQRNETLSKFEMADDSIPNESYELISFERDDFVRYMNDTVDKVKGPLMST